MSDVGEQSNRRRERSSSPPLPHLTNDSSNSTTSASASILPSKPLSGSVVAPPVVRSTLSNKTLPAPSSLPARPSAALRLDPAAVRNPPPLSRRPPSYRARSPAAPAVDRYIPSTYTPARRRRSPSPPSARRQPDTREREYRLRELDQELDRYKNGDKLGERYSASRGEAEYRASGNREPYRPRSPVRDSYVPNYNRARRSPTPERRLNLSPPRRRPSPTRGPVLSLHERIFGTSTSELARQQEDTREDNSNRERKYQREASVEEERERKRYRDEGAVKENKSSEFPLASPPTKKRKLDSTEPPQIPTGPRFPSSETPTTSSIPTGPKATRNPIPTGPSNSGIPTGPRGSTNSQARNPQTPYSPHPQASSVNNTAVESSGYPERNGHVHNANRTTYQPEDDDMSGRGRGRGGGGYRGKSRSQSKGRSGNPAAVKATIAMTPRQSLPLLDGPMRTRDQIAREFGQDGRLDVKKAWVENPKSPVANWFGAGKGDVAVPYEVERGVLDRKEVYRVSIVLDAYRGVVGVGDSPSRAEGEKLAALSALYQLVATGMINRPNHDPDLGNTATATQDASETVKLSDGTVVAYEKARLFMEYYCNRFKFGKPDLSYDEVTEGRSKRGAKISRWEAVMTVGGRKIGVASGSNKKLATKLCYLDVTQYLESCDHNLWSQFISQDGGKSKEDVRKAPHLLFNCSDNLVELVRELCSEARGSQLFKKAPTPNTVAEPMVIAHQPFTMPADGVLKGKSAKLQERLKIYEVDQDPSVSKMRELRASLPIYSYKEEILRTIDENEVTVLTANTGSGKSTQTPQYILDKYILAGKGADCRILVTQPRRLAALALADRVSDERNSKIGREVGYHVRFDAKLPEDNGNITFMTIGILLKRLQSALSHQDEVTWFDAVSHIVLDEVHERDLDTDLLLVILKRMLKTRKQAGLHTPKILLMSATINADLFREYFKNDRGIKAPLVDVPGKTFPVQRNYLDGFIGDLQRRAVGPASWVFQDKIVKQYLDADHAAGSVNSGYEKEIDMPYPLVAMTICHVAIKHTFGHILVFLPGLEEMKRVHKLLTNEDRRSPLPVDFNNRSKYVIHTLHSTTPVAEQREVFVAAPEGVQRIILATNIAETSVTIPGTTVVVDSGRAKMKTYDPSRHVSALVTSWAGSANLDQRAGRAGRERPGDYYAVFGTNRHRSLRQHQVVEMLRLDLQEVVMHVKALNIGMVEDVLAQAIEPPAEERVEAALSMLRMLGALDSKQNVLPLGKILLQIPCDARLGKLLLFGTVFKCLSPALTIAAILGSRDPFLAPMHLREQSNEIKDFWSPKHFRSDALCVEAAFNAWWEKQSRGDYRSANDFLSDNLLNKATMLGIQQIREQLYDALVHANALTLISGKRYVKRRRQLVVPEGFDVNADSLPLKAALISIGSIPNFAIRTSPKTCRTAQDANCLIHVSSVNNKKREDLTPAVGEGIFAGEKRLYTFQEKVASMQGSGAAPKQLRNVTRIDPLTYLLFGASKMRVLENGLEADEWLPITGNLDALDDVQRLRIVMDSCFLRVWEGLDQINRAKIPVSTKSATQSRAASPTLDDDDDEEEREFGVFDEELDKMGRGSARQGDEDFDTAMTTDEVTELGYLSSDVVRILDAFAEERAPDLSRNATRPPTPSF